MAPARREGAGWGRQAPCAPPPGSGLAIIIANVLWTSRCVQLNGDGLESAHGLVAVAAARVVHSGRFVVIEKSRLTAAIAASCAAKSGSKSAIHDFSLLLASAKIACARGYTHFEIIYPKLCDDRWHIP
jgi:hypothetical protein